MLNVRNERYAYGQCMQKIFSGATIALPLAQATDQVMVLSLICFGQHKGNGKYLILSNTCSVR